MVPTKKMNGERDLNVNVKARNVKIPDQTSYIVKICPSQILVFLDVFDFLP